MKNNYAPLPAEMRNAKRWLVWKLIPDKDPAKKPRKVPFYANGSARNGQLDTPADMAKLATFDDAHRAFTAGGYAGLGFALGPDGTGYYWQGIDLDDIPDHPELVPTAKTLPGYTEQSPSGKGMHAIGYGRAFNSLGSNRTGIEAYSSGRYFTVTATNANIHPPTCLADFVEKQLVPMHRVKGATQSDDPNSCEVIPEETITHLRSALNFMTADDRDLWQRNGHRLKGLGDIGRGIFMDWSATSDKFDPKADIKTWESFKPTRTGYKAIFTEAQKLGWVNPASKTFDPAAVFAETDWESKYELHVARYNETHASVLLGGKHRVMRFNRDSYEFIIRRELELLHANSFIQIGVKKNGEPIFKNVIAAWAEHPNARTYSGGVIFLPGREAPAGCWNIWQGFSVKPKQNPILLALLHLHLLKVICDGDLELHNYLLNWIAYGFQHPDKPVGTALVLRGEKGGGKGTLGHFLKNIYGLHGKYISSAKHLIGNFNAHLADTCFLYADEAFYSGDKQHEGVLKSLITEPVMVVERKGIDAVMQPNYLKILMTTNSVYAVPATRDERRFCVFDVASTHIGDRPYFNALHGACENPDVQAAFLYEMLHRDLSDFHTGDIPESVGLRAQRYHSMDSVQKWVVDCLTNGAFGFGWREEMPSTELYEKYIAWCDTTRAGEYKRVSQTLFGKYLGEVFKRVIKDGGYRWYWFGSLENAVGAFEKYEKIKLSELTTITTITNHHTLEALI